MGKLVSKKFQQMLTNDLLNEAVKFHGHFGPFLILGLRAGLIGVGYLGKSYFELSATVKTNLNPPRSCFIDGVQFVSGCTTGKGNLEQKALDQLTSEEQVETSGREILQKTDDELFLMKEGLRLKAL